MKYIGWILALILVGVCVYLWNFQDAVYLPGDIIFDTVRVVNPIDEKLIIQAEKTFALSEHRKREIDSLRALIEGITGDNEYERKELEAIIKHIENERDSIATALFSIGNVKGEVIYSYVDNTFEFDYRKLFDVYARERIKGVEFGISCYVLKKEKWGIELGGMIGFPKIIKRTYLGLKGSSLGAFGAGIHYIF